MFKGGQHGVVTPTTTTIFKGLNMRITINTMSDNTSELINALNVDIHYPEFGGYIFEADHMGVSDFDFRNDMKTTPVIIKGKEFYVVECLLSNQCVLYTITEYYAEKKAREEWEKEEMESLTEEEIEARVDAQFEMYY